MVEILFNNVCKAYDGKTVFENISGKINDQDKIGLVGKNGVGKTTLARLLGGIEAQDKGDIIYSPSYIKTLYIEQYPVFDENTSIYDEILKRATSNHHNDIKHIDAKIQKALNMVGLSKRKWRQRAVSLSGGEKTKLALCEIFVKDFDFLILDEPTNHLDVESSEMLEDFIADFEKPMLIISHDRFFLDNIAHKIWELNPQGLREYIGNYSSYRAQREIELREIQREYDKQQDKILHLKKVINERESWYSNAHKSAGKNDFYRAKAKKHASIVKAKKRELKRIQKNRVDKPFKAKSPAFEVINKNVFDQKLPRFLINGRNLSKSFGKKQILQGVSFDIKRQDKIAVIGQNGVGKTTFLKLICNLDREYQGTVQINPSVKIGYFDQELENVNDNATILEDVLKKGSTIQEARLLLACLLFRGDAVYKKIGDLSMGEKGRVAFAKLILSGANLLVLDEPTNYMDIESKENIEEALDDFEGTIIFVSHDRYFVRRFANRVFQLYNKKLFIYDGDYDYFLKKYREQRLENQVGRDFQLLTEEIQRLELELAFIGGKLNGKLNEEEREKLNKRFLEYAQELNRNKNLLKNYK